MTQHAPFAEAAGATVVALHASASSSIQWKRLADELTGRFVLLAPDLPGYDGQAREIGAPGTDLRPIADPLIEQIAAAARPVHLVGHSFGAGVALKIALTRPDLIKSLTLYEPAVFHFLASGSTEDVAHYAVIRGLADAVAQGIADGSPQDGMRRFVDFWNGPGAWDGAGETGRQRMAAMAPLIQSDFTTSLAETWGLGDLVRIAVPALVLMGLDSPDVAQHVATRIAKAIPGAQLAMLPELGHMAPVFQPEWVNPRIHAHLARAERPASGCFWPQRAAA